MVTIPGIVQATMTNFKFLSRDWKKYWCEHKAGATIYVKDSDWVDVGAWMYRHWNYMCGISFLPYDGGVYQLAPYEDIDEPMLGEQLSFGFFNLSASEKSAQAESEGVRLRRRCARNRAA